MCFIGFFISKIKDNLMFEIFFYKYVLLILQLII